MSVTVRGEQWTFGIPTADVSVNGLVVESATLRANAQVDEEGINNLGLVAAHAVGGVAYEVSITGKFTGTPPAINSTVEVQSQTLVVVNVETAWGERDWKKATLTAKGYEGVAVNGD